MKFEVFADEIFIKNEFLGIGSLFVPINVKSALTNSLTNLRCLGKSKKYCWKFEDCPNHTSCKLHYHQSNNTEIHYRKLGKSVSHPKKLIPRNWMNFLIDNNLKNRGMIYYKILYINLPNLEENYFGDENTRENIYNRFFRTLIKSSRFFFGSNSIKEIQNIYHHVNESHEKHQYFPWYTGYRLDVDEDDFIIHNKEINFVKSDHRLYLDSSKDLVDAAQLLQFTDLIIATVSRNIFNLSNDPVKVSLAETIRPLVKRFIKSPNNPNSRFNYFKKQSISFYPKDKEKYIDLFGEVKEVNENDNFYLPDKLARLPVSDTSKPFK